MKNKILLLGLLILTLFLVGCTNELTILLRLPINVDASYHRRIDGYVYYDYRNDEVILASNPISRRYTEPLGGASIKVLETGRTTHTDRYGYFIITGIPSSYYNVNLDIKHSDLRWASRSRRYSVNL